MPQPLPQATYLCAILVMVAASLPVSAQSVHGNQRAQRDAQMAAPPQENVRMEYARVLSAEPVYQVLRATSMVERCDASTPVTGEGERRGISRVVGAVRDVLAPAEDDAERARVADSCRMVPVEREFRRPIGYEVDYVHKGVKYRSRLPYDPGNRVRVRVSVTPVVGTAAE
ncbi:hypothetical protein E4582_04660 [Luteimonas yindakuii]|uniref:Uncharacterized protein n=1 Tax=Luteimonas yindakuii TaxID=2565782 RepID=A0A4Z1RD95_9GAMM|nr:hypothetical protein [Luteimonas yindakuii]TKS54133.1 hypothetical protein E4582_04660 [Luteimonas yindakuii]